MKRARSSKLRAVCSSVSSSISYFKVGDIQAVAATLQSRGVQFDGPPHLIAAMPDHDLWMAFFRDVEGNLQALMSEVPH